MLASMTGFGRAVTDAPFGQLIAEIQSVNRKYLEIFVSLPKEFSRFEQDVRSWISAKIARGQVSVRLYLIPNDQASVATLPDAAALNEMKKGWEKIAKSLGYGTDAIDFNFLMLHSPIREKIHFAEDRDVSDVKKCIEQALSGLLEMKRKEGNALVRDVKQRFVKIQKHLKEIELQAPLAAQKMQKNLLAKLQDLKPGALSQKFQTQEPRQSSRGSSLAKRASAAQPALQDLGPKAWQEFLGKSANNELDDRIARELILFADKVDITEEITRLKSHFLQFQEILKSQKESVGRKIDFLIQEMGREINTIGSKSPDAQISHTVVNIKSELEKIREQIQNIE
ncbi:MAG TPA: DUF1732 domain-containing protein [Chlamydiales bacterium]|nr:DUF1732 domain-containing protein [Chlamydiales bacterium]